MVRDDDTSASASTLPTPPSTATPEPRLSTQPADTHSGDVTYITMKPDPAHSPILPAPSHSENSTTSPLLQNVGLLSASLGITPTSPTFSDTSTVIPEAPEDEITEQKYSLQGLAIQAILQDFAEDPLQMASDFEPSSLPTTINAFEKACNAYNIKLQNLSHILQSEL